MSNLVLITSVINTPNLPLSYSKVRSVFTRGQRFTQTKQTIESIKEKIPDCRLMIVECTDFTKEEKAYFEKECDYVLNLWERKDVHEHLFGPWKAMGEGTMTIEAIKYIEEKNIEFKSLFKISGRYWLGDKFNYEKFTNDKLIFKHNENGIVGTTLYKIPKKYIKNINDLLFNILFVKKNKQIMYEYIFTMFVKTLSNKVKFVDIIGVNGFCTTKGQSFSF